MKILYITRKYPPQVGGMERVAYELFENLGCEKKLIALRKKQIHLLWFIPFAFFKALFIARKYDLIYLADGVIAPIGIILRFFTRIPVAATIHGLEVTYDKPIANPIYKTVNLPSIRRLDLVIAISEETRRNCIRIGVPEDKCTIIPDGIDIDMFGFTFSDEEKEVALTKVEEALKIKLGGKKVLLTVGRLVKRKGVEWFIRNVMNKLREDAVYVVIGEGSEHDTIKRAIREMNLESRVIMAGRVSDQVRDAAYRIADVFLMPNIKVRGDQEGFGITAIEGALAGVPVIASGIEGLKDALQDQETGMLVESGNAGQFVVAIEELLSNPEEAKSFGMNASKKIVEKYNWIDIAQKYEQAFASVLKLKN